MMLRFQVFFPGEAQRDDDSIRCMMAGASSRSSFRPEFQPRESKDDTALLRLVSNHETQIGPSSQHAAPRNEMLVQRALLGQTLGGKLSCQDDEAVRLLVQGKATRSMYTDHSRGGDRLNKSLSRDTTSYLELQGSQAIQQLITGREADFVRAAHQDDGAIGLLLGGAAVGSRRVAEQGNDDMRRLLSSSQGERHVIQDATMWSRLQVPAGTLGWQNLTQPLAAPALRPRGGLVNQLSMAEGAASRDDELLSQLLHSPPQPVALGLHSSLHLGASCGLGGRGSENHDDLMLRGLLDGTWSDPAVDHGADDLRKLESLIQYNTAQALLVSH